MNKQSLMYRLLIYTFLLFTGMIVLQSCRKNNTTPPSYPSTLQVISFAPASAAKDSIVVITGTGFSSSLSENSVSFNGKTAVVIAASNTSLTVKVPKGAHDGKITVTTNGQTGNSVTDFTYIYTVTTLAGSGNFGFRDGAGAIAEFNTPYGLAADASGNVYVADAYNNRIRKITPDGTVSTFAGSSAHGSDEGAGDAASFYQPWDVAVSNTGNIYVSDVLTNRVRSIVPLANGTGYVSNLAGDGHYGFKDGPGSDAQFRGEHGIGVDAVGNVYVADLQSFRIRKITLAANAAAGVSTIAGDGTDGFKDGAAADAKFSYPSDVAVDITGNVYVADAENNRVRKITPTGIVSTFGGDGTSDFRDGAAADARFNGPVSIVSDAAGNVYVADVLNNRIRRITPAGIVSTIAGDGNSGFKEGTGNKAQFDYPTGIAVDAAGNIYVADAGNYRVRKLE